MAAVQAVFSLPGRQTQGFLESLFEMMKLDLSVPDHSTLSRRRASLKIEMPIEKDDKARHLVVDSTGVKVYGEGEWKVLQHGWSKRRTWVKLHICGDELTLEIISACVTTNDLGDGETLPDLLASVPGGNRPGERRWCIRSAEMLRRNSRTKSKGGDPSTERREDLAASDDKGRAAPAR